MTSALHIYNCKDDHFTSLQTVNHSDKKCTSKWSSLRSYLTDSKNPK